MLSKTKSAAPTLRGNEKQAAKALERAVDLATHPPPSDELIQACADAFSRSPPSVAEAGVRHLRKKLQAADKNYDVALLSCGVAGRVVAASPAAQKAVGSGDGGKKFMAVMLKQACDRRPSQLQKGARQLIETWQATYASNPGLPYFATVAVELAAFKHQNGEAPSTAPTDALQFAGGPQLTRRGAASGMDDSASLSAASLQRHREAAEAAQIRQAIADQHTTLDEAPTSTSQEEAMLARAMEESRQSASAAAPDAFAPVAPR